MSSRTLIYLAIATLSAACGLVIEIAAGMVEAVISLLDSAKKRQRLGKAGLEYVRRVHSHESIAQRLEEAILEAIHR